MRLLLAIAAVMILAWGLTDLRRGIGIEGIDVSHWQGEIDWRKVRDSGIDFVYLKATEGVDGVDRSHAGHRKTLSSLGMLHGSYHFLAPDLDGAAQARHFIEVADPRSSDLLPVVDVETAGARLPEVLKAYIAEIRSRLGVDPVIYVSPAFWNEHLAPHGKDWPNVLWVAEYGVKTPKATRGIGPWTIWQYTNAGSVPGIKGRVDRDRARSMRHIRMR